MAQLKLGMFVATENENHIIMKQITFLALVAIVSFSSCKKQNDYTCKCDGGFSGAGVTNTIKSTSASKAEKECKALDSGSGVFDGLYNCRLVP